MSDGADGAPVAEALADAVAGREVPAARLEAAFGEIADGAVSPVRIAALLVALRTRGETPAEMAAIARALRARAETAPLADPRTVDTCGTGGDGAGTFNISTAAALVAAGAGVPVAKHGNRAASSRAGSFDVLEALGVAIELPVAAAARVLAETGFGPFFARRAHPAMRHVAPVRG
ncbi:MAG: anthranilate phosphoribosyltransferase, partial [Myxococcota bacterium]|nr:anthranilate phosphoribosyltransferase [Myxococcota bacterium]